MYKVKKRDGQIVEFDIQRIANAITQAFKSVNRQYDQSQINMICLQVTSEFESKIKDGVIGVEDIQDAVEKVLSSAGFSDVAKHYILYRKNRLSCCNFSYYRHINQFLFIMKYCPRISSFCLLSC